MLLKFCRHHRCNRKVFIIHLKNCKSYASKSYASKSYASKSYASKSCNCKITMYTLQLQKLIQICNFYCRCRTVNRCCFNSCKAVLFTFVSFTVVIASLFIIKMSLIYLCIFQKYRSENLSFRKEIVCKK